MKVRLTIMDGRGVLQPAGAWDGGVAARVMSNIAPGHVLNGGIGWGRYVGLGHDEFDRREVMLRYRFTRNTTFLQGNYCHGVSPGTGGFI